MKILSLQAEVPDIQTVENYAFLKSLSIYWAKSPVISWFLLGLAREDANGFRLQSTATFELVAKEHKGFKINVLRYKWSYIIQRLG